MPPEETIDVQPDSSTGTGEVPASPPETVDPLQQAIDSGDYKTYERLANEEDIGRAKPEKSAARESGEPAPASQPVKKQESKPQGRPLKPHALEIRLREVLAENNLLRQQAQGKPAESGVTQASPPAQPPPQAAPPPAPEPPKDDPMPILDHKPDRSRWKNYEEYFGALKDWWIREGGRQAIRTATENQRKAAEAQVQAQWKQRWEAVAKDPEYPDYLAVAGRPDVSINPTTKGFLLTSEHGPKMLYHLGKNPDIAARLAQSDPYSTMRFLVQMEAAFTEKPAPPKKEEPTPTKRITRMPPPPTDLGARNAASPQDELDAAVEAADYARYERLANDRDIRNARGR